MVASAARADDCLLGKSHHHLVLANDDKSILLLRDLHDVWTAWHGLRNSFSRPRLAGGQAVYIYM